MEDSNQTTPESHSVCGFYRRGNCRHGQSGKTPWQNSTQCKYRHPKKCYKYCKYGTHPVMGCNNKYCKLMHPLLCKYSIEEGSCPFPNCHHEHLVGTVKVPFFRRNINEGVFSPNHHKNGRYGQRRSYLPATQRNPSNTYGHQSQSYRYNEHDFPPLLQNENPNFEGKRFSTTLLNEKQSSDVYTNQDIIQTLKNIQTELAMIKREHYTNTHLSSTNNNINATAQHYATESYRQAQSNNVVPHHKEISKNSMNPANQCNYYQGM